ncbi:MAG: 16S rRNA (guanine(966)-N(2))-methyltransferase RsmD [Oligoflexia bacterium]|nr:16S rRNA (guanine(966)-N(2))-methyltransferase RsmD [Oligoflexia bacterium]
MRIIAGAWKGRKLKSWSDRLPVRPMTDRVKETVFNVLSPYLFEDCKVLDLFSGTGSLALEALSRGASLAHGVENHSSCIKLIQKNRSFLPKDKKLWIHKKNVFSFLKQNQKQNVLGSKSQAKIPAFDIVLVDPPFALKAGDSLMQALSSSLLIHKETVIAIETEAGEQLKNRYFDFYLFSKKDFNDKKVWFYKAE